MMNSDYSHEVAVNAYYNWWKDNEGTPFVRFKSKDPLLNTAFRWK